jgi:Spy/CpxP family protein refolding chaperone
MKRSIVIGTLIASLAVGGVALARGPGGGGGGFFGPRMARLLEDLNLTEQQKDLAIDIRVGLKKQAKAMRRAHIASMDEVAAELAKPKPDAAKLHRILDQRAEEMRKLGHQAVDQFLTLHATLSNEQRAQLVAKLQKMEERAKKLSQE